jgi:hypothetical protein
MTRIDAAIKALAAAFKEVFWTLFVLCLIALPIVFFTPISPLEVFVLTIVMGHAYPFVTTYQKTYTRLRRSRPPDRLSLSQSAPVAASPRPKPSFRRIAIALAAIIGIPLCAWVVFELYVKFIYE